MSDGEKHLTIVSTPRPSNIANPGTLSVILFFLYTNNTNNNSLPSGLFSFASTTLILSLYNAGARDVTVPNLVVGMAIFCGGLAQLLAGMWEFVRGNTFAATGKHFPNS